LYLRQRQDIGYSTDLLIRKYSVGVLDLDTLPLNDGDVATFSYRKDALIISSGLLFTKNLLESIR
jgi:hypothetical protein